MNPIIDKNKLYGDWATLLLPITSQNEIDYTLLSEEIDILIDSGVTGIYSKEFYNQTEAEFDKIQTLLSEKCNAANMPFQIGCSHMSPQISMDRLRRAKHLAPSYVLNLILSVSYYIIRPMQKDSYPRTISCASKHQRYR